MKAIAITTLFLLLSTLMFGRSAFKVDGNDVVIDLDGFGVKSKKVIVELWSPSTVRVIATMHDEVSKTPCMLGERNMSPIKFKAIHVQNDVEISTSKMIITVKENGLVNFLTRDGRRLMIESDRAFEPSGLEEGAYKVVQKFFLNRREAIYGFGHDGKKPRYNIREQSFKMEQDNVATYSPVFFSELGFAFIWNNYSETTYSEAATIMTITSEVADEISFFFTYESNWDTLLSESRKAFGHAMMLPLWAYGFHLNPDAYPSESALNDAIDRYKELGIPVESEKADHSLLKEEKTIYANKSSVRFANSEAFRSLQGQFQALKEENPANRHVVPTHINIPGIQRYGVYTTAGDTEGSWEALKAQTSAGINASLTGQAHWSSPIGGVKPKAGLSEQSRSELLARWFQFAAFTPVFQGGINAEIWNAGSPESPAFKAIAKSIKLRYQLMPYIYSTAWSAAAENKAIMRSLLYDFQTDKEIANTDQQYLFGSSIMVCPVTTEGASKLKVQLPAGAEWYNFWTGKKQEGGKNIETNVVLEHIPLFIKGGSIVPLITVSPDSLTVKTPIELRIYPGANASYVYYNDEGDGNGYQTGHFTKVTFDYTEKGKTLSIGTPEGTHHGSNIDLVFRIVLVSETNGVGMNESATFQEINYKGKRAKIKL